MNFTRVRRFARAHWLDALIVLAAAAAALDVAAGNDSRAQPEMRVWLAVPAIALVVLPLLTRRRYPLGAPASVWLLTAALSFVDGTLVPVSAVTVLVGIAAAYLLGNLHDGVHARVGLAIVVGSAAIVTANDPVHTPGELIFIPLVFAIGWSAGYTMRGRADEVEAAEARVAEAERAREVAARVAVAEERARIARELHDVVAHAVSVMVLQVGASRRSLSGDAPEQAQALERVEWIGRTALAEMSQLLSAMHIDDEPALAPQPGLGDLSSLLAEVERAGLPVRLRTDGHAAALPEGLQLSAYRIIQESLTNALRHARASSAVVTVRYGPEDIHIEVRDDGLGAAPGDTVGRGLLGIRERVNVYGGEFSTEAPSGGGFVVNARLPLPCGER